MAATCLLSVCLSFKELQSVTKNCTAIKKSHDRAYCLTGGARRQAFAGTHLHALHVHTVAMFNFDLIVIADRRVLLAEVDNEGWLGGPGDLLNLEWTRAAEKVVRL